MAYDSVFREARRDLTIYMMQRALAISKETGVLWVSTPAPTVPETLAQMKEGWQAAVASDTPYPVSDLASSNTIYLTPDANYAFRFVHDYFHVKLDAGADLEGERVVAEAHLADARQHKLPQLAIAVLWADTYGQSEFHAKHGRFPVDQLGFVIATVTGGDTHGF
jgi:hypothetical protein